MILKQTKYFILSSQTGEPNIWEMFFIYRLKLFHNNSTKYLPRSEDIVSYKRSSHLRILRQINYMDVISFHFVYSFAIFQVTFFCISLLVALHQHTMQQEQLYNSCLIPLFKSFVFCLLFVLFRRMNKMNIKSFYCVEIVRLR